MNIDITKLSFEERLELLKEVINSFDAVEIPSYYGGSNLISSKNIKEGDTSEHIIISTNEIQHEN